MPALPGGTTWLCRGSASFLPLRIFRLNLGSETGFWQQERRRTGANQAVLLMNNYQSTQMDKEVAAGTAAAGHDVLDESWRLRGEQPAHSRRLAEKQLQQSRSAGNGAVAARAQRILAWHLRQNAQFTEAIELLDEVLAGEQKRNDPVGIAATLVEKGINLHAKGDTPGARTIFEQVLSTGDKDVALADKARAQVRLAAIERVQGDIKTSELRCEHALRIFEDLDDRNGIGEVFYNRGLNFFCLSNYAEALRCYRESLQHFRATGNRRSLNVLQRNIAVTHNMRGEIAEGTRILIETLELQRARGFKQDEAATLTAIGSNYYNLGDNLTAIDYQLQSLSIYREVGDVLGEAIALLELGRAYEKLEHFQDALDCYHECLKVSKRVGEKHNSAAALNNIGSILLHEKKYEEALEYFFTSLEQQRTVGHKQGVAIALANIGRTYRHLGHYLLAADYMLQHLTLCQEIDDARGKAQCFLQLGKLCKRDFESSEELLTRALAVVGEKPSDTSTAPCVMLLQHSLALAAKLDARNIASQAYYELYQLFKTSGDFDRALQCHEQYVESRDKETATQNELKLRNLRALHEVERARKEAEIHRLKNVELRQALHELQQANSDLSALNDEKDNFLGIASHDLKNPLGNISSIARIVHKSHATIPPAELCELMEDIAGSSQRMLRLIEDLLDINAIERRKLSIRLQGLDAAEQARAALARFTIAAGDKDIALQLRAAEDLTPVRADEALLARVLDNLVSNAIKYSPAHKRVVLSLRLDAERILFELRDEGPGISTEDMPKLFGKFARLSARPTAGESSTGLGLSIVKSLVEEMQGEVWCESEPGKGAVFLVALPVES